MEGRNENVYKMLGDMPKQITLQSSGGNSTIKLLTEAFSALSRLSKKFSTLKRGLADNKGWH